MKYLYFISVLLLIYSFLRIKKSNQKCNFILWLCISIIVFMAYNSFVIFAVSIMRFKATLIVRGIINVIISIILLIRSRKRRQHYKLEYQDLFPILAIILIIFSVGLFRFGNYLSLDFEITDALVHYDRARIFSETNTLLEFTDIDSTMFESYKGQPQMFFSYTNLGTMMQLIGDFFGEYKLYQVFIIFELFSFFIGGILFYYLIKSDKSSVKNQIFNIILIVLYMLGYPLVNLLYGFHYWGLYVLVLETILLLLRKYKTYNSITIILSLSLLFLSIFSSYYMMVPVIYGATGLYLLYLWKIKHYINFPKLFIDMGIILIIPFLIGMIYFIMLPHMGKEMGVLNAFSIDGSNYNNILGNFILLIPIVTYYFVSTFKRKEITLESILFVLVIIFLSILFIFMIYDKVSIYYFSKCYNMLWLLVFILIARSLYIKNNSMVYIIIIVYFIMAMLCMFKLEEKLRKNINVEDNIVVSKVANIYENNSKYLLTNNYVISKDLNDLILYVIDNYDKYKNVRGEIPFVATYFQKLWICEIYNIIPTNKFENKNQFYINNMRSIEEDSETRYIVFVYNKYKENLIDFKKYKIVYKSKAGCILEKKY